MASPTQWTGVWASSGSWGWTGKPGVLQSMGVTKSWTWLSNWTELSSLQGGETSLICSICQFPWCKCSHCDQFQTTNTLSLNAELGRDAQYWLWPDPAGLCQVGENPEEVSLLSDFHSPLSIDWRSRLLISVFSLSTMTLFKQTYDAFHSPTRLGWCEWGGGMMEDRTSIRQEWGFRPMCCYNTLAPCLPFSEISPSALKIGHIFYIQMKESAYLHLK